MNIERRFIMKSQSMQSRNTSTVQLEPDLL